MGRGWESVFFYKTQKPKKKKPQPLDFWMSCTRRVAANKHKALVEVALRCHWGGQEGPRQLASRPITPQSCGPQSFPRTQVSGLLPPSPTRSPEAGENPGVWAPSPLPSQGWRTQVIPWTPLRYACSSGGQSTSAGHRCSAWFDHQGGTGAVVPVATRWHL